MQNLFHASGEKRKAADFIIPAIDVETAEEAYRLIDELAGACDTFKLGKHFLLDPNWSEFVERILQQNLSLFLDMKDFETGESSRLFAKQVYNHPAIRFFTVHAFSKTIEAAASVRRLGPYLLAVPLLTSFGPKEVKEFYNWDGSIHDLFMQKAQMSLECGVDGLISSAQEVLPLRERFGEDFTIIVPGFYADHARTGTPGQAIKDGADNVVIGRRIVKAKDRKAAFEEVAEEIDKVI